MRPVCHRCLSFSLSSCVRPCGVRLCGPTISYVRRLISYDRPCGHRISCVRRTSCVRRISYDRLYDRRSICDRPISCGHRISSVRMTCDRLISYGRRLFYHRRICDDQMTFCVLCRTFPCPSFRRFASCRNPWMSSLAPWDEHDLILVASSSTLVRESYIFLQDIANNNARVRSRETPKLTRPLTGGIYLAP